MIMNQNQSSRNGYCSYYSLQVFLMNGLAATTVADAHVGWQLRLVHLEQRTVGLGKRTAKAGVVHTRSTDGTVMTLVGSVCKQTLDSVKPIFHLARLVTIRYLAHAFWLCWRAQQDTLVTTSTFGQTRRVEP